MEEKKSMFKKNIFIDCTSNKNKIDLDTSEFDITSSFDIIIEFSTPIIAFRNHNYQWVDLSEDRISNDFSPKIIKLQNGKYVQANLNFGIWEINKKQPTVLLWRFNPEFAAPLTQYSNELNTKKIVAANSQLFLNENLALLITQENSIELSRSEIPFSAIACFTDHCDFDTAQNLKVQREFLKEINLKITKGFFLNHFSKRADNASFETDRDELLQWKDDGHELCYHSLTQSIRDNQDAFNEFYDFIPPLDNITVWIDHGFQPYNFSMFEKNEISKQRYETTLLDKNINVLCNYIDAATATKGILNQLNPSDFNLDVYSKSISELPFLKRMVMLIKNIIFHYDNDEFRVRNYIETITHTKQIFKKGKVFEIFSLFKNATPVVLMLFKVLVTWNSSKKKTYKVAKYSPVFFKHKIDKNDFYIFQAIEMVDFTKALCKENIDTLVQDSGLFIAHTYLSVNMNHYSGKLINSDTTLNSKAADNFKYLAEKVNQKRIWNPTLSEFLAFYKNYQETIFDIDGKDVIFIKNKNTTIPSRVIQ